MNLGSRGTTPRLIRAVREIRGPELPPTVSASPGHYHHHRTATPKHTNSRRLRDPSHSITQIALHCGFEHPTHFATAFRRYRRQIPSEYRRRYLLRPTKPTSAAD